MIQLQIDHCLRDEATQLCELLEEMDALSITMTDKHDDPILEPALGTLPLWPHVIIQALYPDKEASGNAVNALAIHHPHIICTIETLVDKDWERVCMDDFKPLQFGKRLWVCPSWLTPPDPSAVNLILDPGLAFGTGTHQTTSLCLSWLEQAELEQKDVIDYGCGSGILALAALKLGARHVSAVDIDQQALTATWNNALENGISASQLTASFPETLVDTVDLVIANILLAPLLDLQKQFRQLLHSQGTLVVSGILEEQVLSLIEGYQSHFIHQKTMLNDGWALLVFKCN